MTNLTDRQLDTLIIDLHLHRDEALGLLENSDHGLANLDAALDLAWAERFSRGA